MTATATAAMQALRSESLALATEFRSLTVAELALPTRCEPWTLHTLGGHIIRGIERTAGMLETPTDQPAEDNRLVYYQSPLRSDPARSTTRNNGAVSTAARFTNGSEIGAALEQAIAAIEIAVARGGSDVNVITHWGPVMRLDDYLVTRVVEVAVHGIDVADCLDRTTWLSSEAEIVLTTLIADLSSQSIDARMKPELLIRAATGRYVLSPEECEEFTITPGTFPLLT